MCDPEAVLAADCDLVAVVVAVGETDDEELPLEDGEVVSEGVAVDSAVLDVVDAAVCERDAVCVDVTVGCGVRDGVTEGDGGNVSTT